jgi:predicted RNase H-like nuclease (RuvC/YqgF family)
MAHSVDNLIQITNLEEKIQNLNQEVDVVQREISELKNQINVLMALYNDSSNTHPTQESRAERINILEATQESRVERDSCVRQVGQ